MINCIPKVIILFIISFYHSIASAQRFYVKVVEGYIFSSGSSAYNNADPNGLTAIQPSTDIAISADGGIATIKSLYGSIGVGNKIGLAGGYQLTEHIATELAINYFRSNTFTIGRFSSPLTTQAETCYLRGVDASPTIVIRANNKKFDPYVRAGIIVTIGGSLWIDTSIDQLNGGGVGTLLSVRAKSEVKSQFSMGMLGAAGMQFHITKLCSVFGEVEYKSFSLSSKSAHITNYTTNVFANGIGTEVPGQQLADLPEYRKTFLFSDEFQQATVGTNLTQPRTLPTQKVNLSGVGINAGFVWRL
jgi:hypothetical protein